MSSSSSSAPVPQFRVTSRLYGSARVNGEDVLVTEYTLHNHPFQVTVIDYGAIITSVKQPDRNGKVAEVLLGYPTLDEWMSGKPWFNSLVGRHCGRIKDGKFSIDGKEYQLEKNNLGNHLHGGNKAFNAKFMKSTELKGKDSQGFEYVGVSMKFVSPDGDDGFPGILNVEVKYLLFANNQLNIEFHAAVDDKPTIINLCNHAYWNLTGDVDDVSLGPNSTILKHELKLNASHRTELDGTPQLLPTGKILPVKDTPYDFSKSTVIGSRFDKLNVPKPIGYDLNFCIDKDSESIVVGENGLKAKQAALLYEPVSGRKMTVYTTEPGIQVYTGNFIDGSIIGRNKIKYTQYAAICLETQNFPDSINHASDFAEWTKNGVLRPGEKYFHVAVHKFSAE